LLSSYKFHVSSAKSNKFMSNSKWWEPISQESPKDARENLNVIFNHRHNPWNWKIKLKIPRVQWHGFYVLVQPEIPSLALEIRLLYK